MSTYLLKIPTICDKIYIYFLKAEVNYDKYSRISRAHVSALLL